MFREMRRKDKLKTYSESVQILTECKNGVLSVIGDGGYPYGVPISYVYSDGKIYFHCAMTGHKVDAIKAEPKVSFTVVGADNIQSSKFTTSYKSVVCFGKAKMINTDEEKMKALKAIADKYSADFPAEGLKYIDEHWSATAVVAIDIEHMTGKGLEK